MRFARVGRTWSRMATAAVPLVFLGLFVAWPLVAVLVRSFTGVSSGRAGEVLTRASTWEIVGFTAGQAALSAVLTLLVGLPIAHALARYRFRGRSLLRAITVVPFVLPTLVVAAAFDGILDDGLPAILAAHVFFNIAVVIRVVGGFWQQMDHRPAEAAAALGASPRRVFRHVTFPQLRPVLAGSAVLVFLFSFTSFGIILVLGGPSRATVETEIYRFAVFRSEFDVAAGLALVQLCVVASLAAWLGRFQRRLNTAPASARSASSGSQPVATIRQRLHLTGVVALALLVVCGPLFSLVLRSFRNGSGYGLRHYIDLTERIQLLPVTPARALLNSVVFAIVAASVAVLVGVVAAFAARRDGWVARLIEAAAFVPLGVSAVTLGFGYLVGFAVFDLRSSAVIVPLAHSVMGVPFVLSAVAPALRSIPQAMTEAGRALGANPTQIVRRIEWPMIRPAVLTGAGFGIAVSLGEFGATAFLARGDNSFTAPLAIFRLLSQPGETLRGQAAALSVTIGVVVAAIGFGLEWFRSTKPSTKHSGVGLI